MSHKVTFKNPIRLDLNRVEGDLEIEIQVEDGHISDAHCVGTMYRGFEQIMIGRAALDSLVITPRVCGICGTAHLASAVQALEHAFNIPVAKNGTRIRNLCLLAEEGQSDIRQSFLMFCVDLCDKEYESLPGYKEVVSAFTPFKGKHHIQAIQHSKKLVEIVAILGGQWPHSSYMLPGGVTTVLEQRKIDEIRNIVESRILWYEQEILGCSLKHWLSLDNAEAMHEWLEDESNQSAMALFSRFSRHLELHKKGKGCSNLLSFGSSLNAETWQPPYTNRDSSQRSGFYDSSSKTIQTLDHLKITEDLSHSWFSDPIGQAAHPWQGSTIPNYLPESEAYSWAKAPRYEGKTCQTGALAQLVVAGDPMITDLYNSEGDSAWLRQFSRLHRPVLSFLEMLGLLDDLSKNIKKPTMLPAELGQQGRGYGLINAARGALGHWIEVDDGKISGYQIVTPTAWNASPQDVNNEPGHMEASLLGLPYQQDQNPLTIGHVVRSNDPCLVCTVHHVGSGNKIPVTPFPKVK